MTEPQRIAEAAGWRTIDSAPKDGTILAFMPTYYQGKGGIIVACWLDGGWYDNSAWRVEPTHWMPLPEAPK